MSHLEDMIDILYASNGEYILSDMTIELYNQKMSKLNPKYKPIKLHYGDCDSDSDSDSDYNNSYSARVNKLTYMRHDPILIEIYKEIRNEFGASDSRVKLKKIPKKYENCYITLTNSRGEDVIAVNIDK